MHPKCERVNAYTRMDASHRIPDIAKGLLRAGSLAYLLGVLNDQLFDSDKTTLRNSCTCDPSYDCVNYDVDLMSVVFIACLEIKVYVYRKNTSVSLLASEDQSTNQCIPKQSPYIETLNFPQLVFGKKKRSSFDHLIFPRVIFENESDL